MKTKPPNPESSRSRPCLRCGAPGASHIWAAASRDAGRLWPELRLCQTCIQALRSMLDGYRNKVRQKEAAAKAKEGSP
jgi:hypothetical protein